MTDLLRILTEVSGQTEFWLWSAFLVFLRVGAVMALMPGFGEQIVPARIRLVLALAFTAVVALAVAPQIGPSDGAFLIPMLAEVLAGLAIGISLRLFIMALTMAGMIIAQATSLAQVFGGMGPEPQPAIANMLVTAGLALAVVSGLHVRAAELMILSYDMLPPGRLPVSADLADWGLDRIARAFSLAFSLAAPFTIAALIYNVALGIINRAMPQLMVSFVGAPALTAGGLILLALATPLLLGVWLHEFYDYLDDPFAGGG
ncbi:MAG: flagellar biosynthetic protein FliR [Paracoccaceae bacterium]